ncbi:hypothetical protein CVIRNUC_006139 [Coccomyxa viridis]|uniref:Secreted protein n=1 Tax=Coccomyxa viridis TaxID=1274662 RepID=A0AAV1IAH4_9CHLO|nr:hypothetical protein CVIRNUC_006139 [Coccomyxa viridis]
MLHGIAAIGLGGQSVLLSKLSRLHTGRAALSSLFVVSLATSMAWGRDSYAVRVGHVMYRKAVRKKGCKVEAGGLGRWHLWQEHAHVAAVKDLLTIMVHDQSTRVPSLICNYSHTI